MNRLTLVLGGLGATAVLFVGGVLLGRVLASDGSDETADDRRPSTEAVVLQPARAIGLDEQGEPQLIDVAEPELPGAVRLLVPAGDATPAPGGAATTPADAPSGAVPSGGTPADAPSGGSPADAPSLTGVTASGLPASFAEPAFVDWFDPDAADETLDELLEQIPMERYEPPSTPVLPDELIAIADTLDDDELEAAIDAAIADRDVTGVDATDLTDDERAEIGGFLGRFAGISWFDLFDEPITLFSFIDPCADPDGTPPDTCPPGIGGTIIAPTGDGDGDDAIPPFRLFKQIYREWTGWQRCENFGFIDGTYHAVIVASHPAEITVRYHSNRTPDDGLEIVFGPSEEEVDRWVDSTARGFGAFRNDAQVWVHYCVALPIPDRWSAESNVMLEISGVDELGDTDSFTTNFPIRQGRSQTVARPPITFDGDVRSTIATLTVPYNWLRETVWIRLLPQVGANRPTCTDAEPDVLAGEVRNPAGSVRTERVSYPRRDGDGYVPDINDAVLARLALEEGRSYRVCVWIVNPPRRSFDGPTIVRREQFEVRAPRLLRTEIWLEAIQTGVPIDVDDITVVARNWRPEPLTVPRQVATAPDMAVSPGRTRLGRLLLDAGSYQTPWLTALEISYQGNTIETAVSTQVCNFGFAGCPPRVVGTYQLPIPGPGASMLGFLEVSVLGVAGPAGSPGGIGTPDGWVVGETSGFTAADVEPDEVPPEPRIDSFNTRLTTGVTNDGQGRIALVVAFDRDVRLLEVSPRLWSDHYADDPCHQPETVDRDTFRDEHTVSFDACVGAYYSVMFIAEDRAGNRLDLTTRTSDYTYSPTGTGYGHERVRGFRVDDLTLQVVIDRLGTGATPSYVRGTIFGLPVNWAEPARCLTGGGSFTLPTFGGFPVRPYGRAIEWHEEFVPFELEVGYYGPTECGPAGGPTWSFAGAVRHRDLLGGEPGRTVFQHEDDDIAFRIVMRQVSPLLD